MHKQVSALDLTNVFCPTLVSLLLAGCAAPPKDADDGALTAQALTAAPGADEARVGIGVDGGSPPSTDARIKIVQQLENATAGLLFTSESDYPFEVLYWKQPGGRPSVDRVAVLTGHVGDAAEVESLDRLFEGATTPQPGDSPEDLALVQRFRDLEHLLRKKLSYIQVFRFGKIQIHTYIVGVTSSGSWAGLSTVQIET